MMRLATVGGSPVCRGPYRHSPKSPEVSPNQGHGVGGPAVEVFTFPVGRAVTYKPRVYPGRGGPAELVQNFAGRLPLRRVGGLVGHQVSLIVPKEGVRSTCGPRTAGRWRAWSFGKNAMAVVQSLSPRTRGRRSVKRSIIKICNKAGNITPLLF